MTRERGRESSTFSFVMSSSEKYISNETSQPNGSTWIFLEQSSPIGEKLLLPSFVKLC